MVATTVNRRSGSMLLWRIVIAALCVLGALAPLAAHANEHHDTLGVQPTATLKQIESAYRRLTAKHHPDRSDAPDAEAKFSKINQAYTALKDELTGKNQEQQGGFGGFGGPFGSFFNNAFNGGDDGQGRNSVPTGPHVQMTLYVTLEQAYTGTVVDVTRVKGEPVETSGTRNCKCKQVRQRVQMAPGFFTETLKDKCEQCPNIKFVPTPTELHVEVEEGVPEGHRMTFYSEGDPHIDGINGDLYFDIHTVKHKIFTRRGLDLYTNVTLPLVDALTGFEHTFTHLDKHKFVIKRNEITSPGHIDVIKGEGMPAHEGYGDYGDLYVTYNIAFPTGTLDTVTKDSVGKLFSTGEINAFNGLGK